MPPKSKTKDDAVKDVATPEQQEATTPPTPEQPPEATATPTPEQPPESTVVVGSSITPVTPIPPDAFPKLSVSVCCTRAQGIWRAGRYWPAEAVTVELDAFTDEQWQQIEAEPLLRIRVEG